MTGVYFGLSAAAGGLLGGLWYEQLGPWGMYRWSGLVMVMGLMIWIVASNLKVKHVANQPVKLA